MKKKYMNIIKPFIPSIIFGGLLIAFMIIVKPSIIWVLSALIAVTLYFGLKSEKSNLGVFFDIIINSAILLFLFGIWRLLGTKGVLGLLIACVLVAIVIIVRRWKLYISTIKGIEELIYGGKK